MLKELPSNIEFNPSTQEPSGGGKAAGAGVFLHNSPPGPQYNEGLLSNVTDLWQKQWT